MYFTLYKSVVCLILLCPGMISLQQRRKDCLVFVLIKLVRVSKTVFGVLLSISLDAFPVLGLQSKENQFTVVHLCQFGAMLM